MSESLPSVEKDAGLIERVLTEHNHYEWWPMTREFICTCEASIGTSYPDPAHRAHVAAALAAAGVGAVADARKYAAKCAAETVRILDREVDVRAEAWDEGYDAHGRDIANEGLTEVTLTPNPYRATGGSDA